MKWLSLLLLLIGFVSIAGLFRRKTVSRPLVVFLGVYSLLWNGIPFVGNFVDFEEYGAFRLIDENVYYKWASIEYLSFFLVTLFLWIRRPHLGWLERRRVWAQVVPIQILTIGLIVALGVVLGVPILIGRVLGGSVQSYTDANAFMATGGATQVYSVLGPIIWVLGVSVAFLYQYLSIDSSLRKRPGWLDALVWAGLTAYVFFSVVNGSRIMILVPLILLFVKFAGRKDRSVTAGVLVGLLGFAFFAFGTGFLASITEQRLVGKVDLDAALSQRSVEGGEGEICCGKPRREI